MRRRAWWVGCLLAFSTWLPLGAVPLERDLGQGLRYYRVRNLPADLPATAKEGGKAPVCVVDLRFVEAEAEAATAFMAWARFRAKPRSPVLVLANASTSAALLRALATRERGGGIVVIGMPARQLEPDLPVKTSGEEERRAYDALEKNVPVSVLITDNPDKVRNDEASFSRERLADASAEAATEAVAPKGTPPPPLDLALQRAVHLHRSLGALRRL